MPAVNYSFDGDFDAPTSQQQKASPDTDAATGFLPVDKENNARENNVAKIKVVVRQFCMSYKLMCSSCPSFFIRKRVLYSTIQTNID